MINTAVRALVAIAMSSGTAFSCPLTLAVYTERDGNAQVEFQPDADPGIIAHSFRLVPENGPPLDGLMYWNTQGFAQLIGQVQNDCPDGDVTGEELEACIPWQGLVYAVTADGMVIDLPARDGEAVHSILLADLAHSLHHSDLNFNGAIWPGSDQFMLSGCQE